jgi:hypothetical protein
MAGGRVRVVIVGSPTGIERASYRCPKRAAAHGCSGPFEYGQWGNAIQSIVPIVFARHGADHPE